MPERLAELLEIYLEHFNQHPKNGDAYKSFLSKQLCFGHEFVSGPDDVEGIVGSEYSYLLQYFNKVNGGGEGIRTPGRSFLLQRFSKPPPSATRPPLRKF